MKTKARMNLLGIYDLILSFGAIATGIFMISSNYGIFSEYPKEWAVKIPFENWITSGIVTIVIFGLGNIIAAIFSFRKDTNKSWRVSAAMGVLLLISLIFQILILEEYYLGTIELLILGIVQLSISGYIFIGKKDSV